MGPAVFYLISPLCLLTTTPRWGSNGRCWEIGPKLSRKFIAGKGLKFILLKIRTEVAGLPNSFFLLFFFSIMSIVQSDSAWLWSLCNPFVWRETISSALWMSLSNSCFQIKGRKASDTEQPWDDCTRWNLQNSKVFKKSFLNMARRKKKDHVQRVRKGDTSWNIPC